MKAIVDHSLCEGHAKCMDNVPEVFEVREDDRSYTVLDEIPEELRARVERAVKVCPRAAISLEE
ncbi:MAG: ferredoxin [Gammaproteobacteria bacterium]|nr:ferredoxin [Gammaproteobacteria bacterium]